ncbi:MAG: bifunctional DNA-formamidopyrimidine glycosylase/DNA-(apurinic or apyrimidinic site) lyase [Gammaproteobacteria bacterium]
MPELPEVETSRRGLTPHVVGRSVTNAIVRQRKLRHTVSGGVTASLPGCTIDDLRRRAKYLLFDTAKGSLIVHLGMSGSLKMVDAEEPPMAHDHVDIVLDNGRCMRFRDPRRFGCFLWTARDPARHKLLAHLGPEPLSDQFDGAVLHERSRKRRGAVKNFIMDGKIVVGVGNIYASEALFRAGIDPRRQAGRISRARYDVLAVKIVEVLSEAIVQGGTSLRDFTAEDGQPGYFKQELNVYGRADEPCVTCKKPLSQKVIGQRSSFFCTRCQR